MQGDTEIHYQKYDTNKHQFVPNTELAIDSFLSLNISWTFTLKYTTIYRICICFLQQLYISKQCKQK